MDVIVEHNVRDYDAWKAAFDRNEVVRAMYGCRGHTVYRGPDDPNEITIITSWDSREGAEKYFEDPSLKEAMETGGVISEPRVALLEEAETHTYAASRAA